jgi:hypothetical protein
MSGCSRLCEMLFDKRKSEISTSNCFYTLLSFQHVISNVIFLETSVFQLNLWARSEKHNNFEVQFATMWQKWFTVSV